MARNHNGQMALYEVVNKEKFRTAQNAELLRPTQEKAQRSGPVVITPQKKTAESWQSAWTKKPSIFGLNNGKVEVFVPYPIAVTVVMAFVLLLVIAFQFGQAMGRRHAGAVASKASEKASEVVLNLADTAKAAKEMAKLSSASATRRIAVQSTVTPAASTTASERAAEPAKSSENKGDEYAIVLKELASPRDLEPAKQYFDEHGIATEIVKNSRGSYFLLTKERYNSISRGTAFDAATRKIKQVGADYRPPAGYNGFAPQMFSDVYGKKM
jgi:hypothetical protein